MSVGNEHCEILSRYEIITRNYSGWQATLDALLSHAPTETPKAIGISCGGPLDSARGLILSPPNLIGWDRVPIVNYLKDLYHVPVFLQNDANACALAEWRFGAGQGCQNVIFLTFGTGLGAGLILDGQLYCGTNDMAGELGHIRAEKEGPIGYGKAGSFEGFCSGGGLLQLTGGIDAREAIRQAELGDLKMRHVLKKSAYQLGRALAILIDLLNPEKIIIGSIYARAEKWFYPTAMEVIEQEALRLSREVCNIVPSALGDSVGDFAALSVAINESR